ncbi:tetratricopeptide repeat protein [Pseudomonas sp. MWU13-2105]|uniref:tetratricopeptide repeat protein n=1 Tax=Pseudomonas sp. MWU13-2105 TaxID=2935074 RepID=UPI00200D6720|nr:tetratricopeptide repeat protein [Pseudomonas sp. MWU13-2105]
MFRAIVLCGLMGFTVGAFAAEVDKEMISRIKADCDVLPDPDIPGFAQDAYTAAVYAYATFDVFKENSFSSEELREYDPHLIAILQEMYKPARHDFINKDLESQSQEAISNLVNIVGPKKKLDQQYFLKAANCVAVSAYSEWRSNEHQHMMFAYQQEIAQADYYADPVVKAEEQARVQRIEAADKVLDQRAKKTEQARVQEAKVAEQIRFQKVQSDTNKRVSSTTTQKVAEPSDPNAQYLLGMRYDAGEGGVHNPQEAMIWFRKSAEQGNGRAQYWLASHYLTGDGVPKDNTQAYVWFSVSAANGYFPATNARDLYGRNLSESQRMAAQELARQYFEKYQPRR